MIGKIDLIKLVRNMLGVRLITAKRLTECRGQAPFEASHMGYNPSNMLNAELAHDLVMTCIEQYGDKSIVATVDRQMRDLKATVNAEMHWGATCPNCDYEVEYYPWLY